MIAQWLLRVEGTPFEELKNQDFQVSKSQRAVRVAFHWRKTSDPNHTSIYALFTRILA